jgi:crotonobetainyl-CoA:carnitine CoA-transferase CaiB-like acyl-CoA transferase
MLSPYRVIDLIDRHLSAWTRRRSAHAAMDELSTAGVPAGAVQSSRDLANDAQYAHREFHRVLHHPEMGTVPYAGTQFRIAGYESGPYACAPMFGEHNHLSTSIQAMTLLKWNMGT